jgi:hypothetical protein
VRPPDFFDRADAADLDDADGIQCRRCGETGLYWMKITQADGMSEKSVLFDSATEKRHICLMRTDAFAKVPE